MQYDEVLPIYRWVKENIKYAFAEWGSTSQTLQRKTGHCGMKSEVLVEMLRQRGIQARYVEGRPANNELHIKEAAKPLFAPLLYLKKVPFFDVHFWVEALVDGQWLELDTAPDSGIVDALGDTQPGMHLGNPTWFARWDELPFWYRDVNNMAEFFPFRKIANIQMEWLRKVR